MNTTGSASKAGPAAHARLTFAQKAQRKAIAAGANAYLAIVPLLYRLRASWRARLGPLDHLTLGVADLAAAEEFYVGLLGAMVVMRIDRGFLLRMGWDAAEIDRVGAVHLSLTFGRGPRLDLFEYPAGIPQETAIHPHIAIHVAPRRLQAWKGRLEAHGVKVVGPVRAGPPGQASLYFNDPSGNHFELVTIGYVAEELAAEMPDRSRLNYAWRA